MMKNILAVILSLCLLLSLAGCAGAPSPEPVTPQPSEEVGDETVDLSDTTIRVASLKGATTMGMVKLLSDAEKGELAYKVDSQIFGTADEITALIASNSLDMAAIPCNLASVLYNKTEGKLAVAAVNTLGVLYVVESGDTVQSVADLAGKTVYSTGKGTTPEYVFNTVLAGNDIDPASGLTVEFKSESTEIAALLADTASDVIAVLPQPYVASVLAQNENVRVALDLTEEWSKVQPGSLVTGVLVVSKEFADANPEAVKAFLDDYKASTEWVNANNADAAALIESYGIVAKAALAQKALPECNIVFQSGDEMKTNVSNYLAALFEQNPKAVGGTLPDEGFYYTA